MAARSTSGARGRGTQGIAEALRGVSSALTAWLTRPLASFHLLLAVFGLLTAVGLVMVLSASSVESFSEAGSSYSVFLKHLLHCLFGAVCCYVAMRTPVWMLRRFSHVFLLVCLVLLVLVLTRLGFRSNGAQSWFVLGPVSFQPVEPAKIALALWGAHVLVTKRALLGQYRHLLVPVLPAALLMFALVMLQPDFGSTVTLGIVLLALLWFAGAPLRLFSALVLGAVTGMLTLVFLFQYQINRVTSFFSSDSGGGTDSFQATQARLALADGGLFGEGIGQGWSKWKYLPEADNDFIFAVLGEELGFVGCAAVLLLFGTVAYVGMRIAARNTDPWIKLVAATLTTWVVGQAAINIGYVVGLLPVTGLPLPLISSGGSSVVTTMIVFGLLANFARHEPEAIAALRSLGPGKVGRLLRLPTPAPYRPPATRRPSGTANRRTAPATKPSGKRSRSAGTAGRKQPAPRQRRRTGSSR
ncbi:cell division-specific peptidoglycan biosynthesis regulator FtsW [Actinopolyspora xinjiangensis]|uniref:Probable peptidoglycan glycosyltransferase FtsW n=1 Tax=Actinopolyspora xinjiangensis TaxID=405564 RepID=A0A1H0SST2_9ACTN|nr:putative lipid II flippase FtsW [Actinopolyspora xinjiangensis]SDP44639.1 cell division-specific peptidoglycan biosynthesis regulator FtsW [Actinopolyspora xinjiangensis]